MRIQRDKAAIEASLKRLKKERAKLKKQLHHAVQRQDWGDAEYFAGQLHHNNSAIDWREHRIKAVLASSAGE